MVYHGEINKTKMFFNQQYLCSDVSDLNIVVI